MRAEVVRQTVAVVGCWQCGESGREEGEYRMRKPGKTKEKDGECTSRASNVRNKVLVNTATEAIKRDALKRDSEKQIGMYRLILFNPTNRPTNAPSRRRRQHKE